MDLLKLGGLISFITPNTFLTNIHSESLRDYILNNSYILNINLYKFKENNLNLYFLLGIINSKISKYFWIKKIVMKKIISEN